MILQCFAVRQVQTEMFLLPVLHGSFNERFVTGDTKRENINLFNRCEHQSAQLI